MGSWGGPGRFKKGRPANLGVRARVWNLAEICGRGSRPGVAQARKTDLARRARAVSESGGRASGGVRSAGECAVRTAGWADATRAERAERAEAERSEAG